MRLGDIELKAATRDNKIYLEKLNFVFILQLLDIIIFRLYVVIDHLTSFFLEFKFAIHFVKAINSIYHGILGKISNL